MTNSLPQNPSVENLQKQAKSLLKLCRSGDSDAISRILTHHPKLGLESSKQDTFLGKHQDQLPTAEIKLTDCQLTLAREYGFDSWPALRREVEIANSQLVDRFLKMATLAYGDDFLTDSDRAQLLVQENPHLRTQNIWTAAATGYRTAVQSILDADPNLVNAKGGPFDREPLLYLCYARVQSDAANPLEAAKLLLDRGADPNAFFLTHGTYRFTCITGAIGEGENGTKMCPPHPQAKELVTLLLQHGANPNDAQGLYNSMFTGGTHWLSLLIDHGLKQGDPINWAADDGVSTLDYLLAHSAKKNMVDRVQLLLEHGADPNCLDWYQKRPCYELALQAGNTRVVELLAQYGAAPVEPKKPQDRFYNACMARDRKTVDAMRDEYGDGKVDRWIKANKQALKTSADADGTETVSFLIELGFPIGEALFDAAWNGSLAAAQLLVQYGASVRQRNPAYGVTPIAYADRAGHEEIVEYLLQHDIDVFDAVRFGDATHVAQVLQNEPAALEHRYKKYGGRGDWTRHTPLIHAVVLGRTKAVQLLLDRGAKRTVKLNGKTLLELAQDEGHEEILQILTR